MDGLIFPYRFKNRKKRYLPKAIIRIPKSYTNRTCYHFGVLWTLVVWVSAASLNPIRDLQAALGLFLAAPEDLPSQLVKGQ